MVIWDNLSTDQLAVEFSDYHKAVHGVRPRYVNENDRVELIHQLKRLDEYMEYMKSTPEGRARLKNEGWDV